jgi:tRNA pseudouridine38-40 synthase
MRNIKITLEYDGADFSGWQVQPGERTVQGVFNTSLQTLLQEPVKTVAAGRTDAGVHARGQVAAFSTRNPLPLRGIHKGLNSLLPPDVVVRRVQRAPADFHPRYNARGRQYLYRIARRPTALDRRSVWVVPYTLAWPLMQRTTGMLPGEHDFSAFCIAPEKKKHCRCDVQAVTLRRVRGEIHFRITADRFLHCMVRILIASLVEVGRGRRSPEEFDELLAAAQPRHPLVVAPPHGLCLMRVFY